VFLPNVPGFSFVHYDVLLFGCLLAIVMHDRRGFAVVRVLTVPWVAFAVAVGFIAAHVALTTVDGLPQQRWISLYAIALVVLLPGLLGHGLPARILANPVLRFIGDRSYSLYLTQILAGMVAQSLFPTDVRGHVLTLITAVIALAMADLLYRGVEQPMIRIGRRLTERREAPPLPAQPLSGSLTAAVVDRAVGSVSTGA
jgi:peptidoglycan/LPS O-acetylase OafA/YrhL